MKSFEREVLPYLTLAPTLLIFGVFLFYPALNGVWISLTKWDGINPRKLISFQSYLKPAADRKFWKLFVHTILFIVWSVPLIYVSALGLVVLSTGETKGGNLFRAVFYRPTTISSIVAGSTWYFLLGEDFGVANYLLTLMGCPSVKWPADAKHAMMVITLVTVRSATGCYMVMFVSEIKGISQTYYEAARTDGGEAWQRFWHTTLPLLKPASLLVVVPSIINVIKTYPLVSALIQGGPAGATKLMMQTMQETGFEKSQMGYTSTVTMVLFLVLSLPISVQLKVNRGGEWDVK